MGYKYTYKSEWGKLLATFGALDLGKTYIYENQLVETFPRDPVEYLDITPERATEMVENYKNSSFYVEMRMKEYND